MEHALISKYNVPAPRYTSYPTVPYWDNYAFSFKEYKESLKRSFEESYDSGIGVYIHLPFCESMCTFCACTKRITKNHNVELPYIKALLKEFELYIELFGKRPIIKQLHIGGGTPTFFSAEHLNKLLGGIFCIAKKAPDCELSFEGHPNNTTAEHLDTLAFFGFDRVSFGIQDYNPEVQRAINRLQPFQNVKYITQLARELGYDSVGHDLIYGLPFQTLDHIKYTIAKTIELMPDRIAFYSYAHVPWVKGNGQRGFDNEDLPDGELKRAQYELGKQLLLEAGYVEIGMDHFALKRDDLYKAMEGGTIHRNFMGYNSAKTQVMIGLGVSAISDSWYGFAQNVKGLEEYQNLIASRVIPVFKGHNLTEEDLIIRKHILNIMCTFKTIWTTDDSRFVELPKVLMRLSELENDGLLIITKDGLEVTEKGRPFVRNICLSFDLRLHRNTVETKLFSMSI